MPCQVVNRPKRKKIPNLILEPRLMKHFLLIPILLFVTLSSCDIEPRDEPSTLDTTALPVETSQIEPENEIEKLRYEDIKDFSLEELRIERNRIFAKHGYKFKNPELAALFKSEGYEALYDNVDDKLSKNEEYNADFIVDRENELKTKAEKGQLTSADIEFEEGTPAEFVAFLDAFLTAAFQEDEKTLEGMVHPKWNFEHYQYYIAQRDLSDDENKITYSVDINSDLLGDMCNEVELMEGEPTYIFTVLWESKLEDAVRDGSMTAYFFKKNIEGNYQLYCGQAAG